MAARVVEDQTDSDYGDGAVFWWAHCAEHHTMGECRDTEAEAQADVDRHDADRHPIEFLERTIGPFEATFRAA